MQWEPVGPYTTQLQVFLFCFVFVFTILGCHASKPELKSLSPTYISAARPFSFLAQPLVKGREEMKQK